MPKIFKITQRLCWLSAILTWPLIALGAIVRLKGAGMACPDWPLCYGKFLPPPGVAFWLEVGHRYWATVLGLLLISIVIIVFRVPGLRFLRFTSALALLLVCFQGLLGALTVWLSLNSTTVIAHLVFGNLLLACLIYLSLQSAYLNTPISRFKTPSLGSVWLALIVFYVMLISGGLNSSTYSGPSCSGFPYCQSPLVIDEFGQLQIVDQITEWTTYSVIHMAHRVVAVVGTIVLFVLAFIWLRISKQFAWVSVLLCLGLLLEIALGAFNALWKVPVPISAMHTAVASTLAGLLAYVYFYAHQHTKVISA